jgi:hypothetical protein
MTVMMLMAAQPRIMGKVHDFRLAADARLGVDRGDGRMRRRNGGRLVRVARRRDVARHREPQRMPNPASMERPDDFNVEVPDCTTE